MGITGVQGLSKAEERLGVNALDDEYGLAVLKGLEWNAFRFFKIEARGVKGLVVFRDLYHRFGTFLKSKQLHIYCLFVWIIMLV